MRQLKPFLTLVILVIAAIVWSRYTAVPEAPSAHGSQSTSEAPLAPPAATRKPSDNLPIEARQMLALIARGGPYEHRQDGVVFGNYEGLLPKQPRGYYHEYTVQTPGAGNRGARRIVTGGTPPVTFYYTDDHYRSFRRIEPDR